MRDGEEKVWTAGDMFYNADHDCIDKPIRVTVEDLVPPTSLSYTA